MSVVQAIDPGPTKSAWLTLVDGLPAEFGILDNEKLLYQLRADILGGPHPNALVIEKIEAFGMAVGSEVFETVFWTGRFAEACLGFRPDRVVDRVGRKAVKIHLCGSMRAKDANIRQALIDRYGGPDAIGRKASPGPLYGVAGDVWSALAVAVTWADQHDPDVRAKFNDWAIAG
jgi:hypothetical protein